MNSRWSIILSPAATSALAEPDILKSTWSETPTSVAVKEGFEALRVHQLKSLYFPSATHSSPTVRYLINCKRGPYTAPKVTGQEASEA